MEPKFSLWENTFSADEYTELIAALLDRFQELRDLMNTLVPEKVSYHDFWMRYLYQKTKIDSIEVKRKQLFESSLDENNFDWDGDDDGNDPSLQESGSARHPSGIGAKVSTETVKARSHKSQSEAVARRSSTSESSTSFDVVSLSSPIPPPEKVSHRC